MGKKIWLFSSRASKDSSSYALCKYALRLQRATIIYKVEKHWLTFNIYNSSNATRPCQKHWSLEPEPPLSATTSLPSSAALQVNLQAAVLATLCSTDALHAGPKQGPEAVPGLVLHKNVSSCVISALYRPAYRNICDIMQRRMWIHYFKLVSKSFLVARTTYVTTD